jgi:hypothetical protein
VLIEGGRGVGDVTGRGEIRSGRQMAKGEMVSEGGKWSTRRGGRVVSGKVWGGGGGSEFMRRHHDSGGPCI